MRSRAHCALLASLRSRHGVAAEEFAPVRQAPGAAADFGSEPRILVKIRARTTEGRVQAQSAKDAVAALAARGGSPRNRVASSRAGLHVMQIEPRTAGEPIDETLARLRADPARRIRGARPPPLSARAAERSALYAAVVSARHRRRGERNRCRGRLGRDDRKRGRRRRHHRHRRAVRSSGPAARRSRRPPIAGVSTSSRT